MTMKRLNPLLIIAAIFSMSSTANALEQIIRPYWSVRDAGMGGVRMTTGLYESNFFGNPARATANPKFRVTILDPAFEFNSNTISTTSDILGGGDLVQKIGDTAGSNNHVRVQTTLPAFYVPTGEEGKYAFAFGLIMSTQADIDLRQNFQASPQLVTDIGPAITVGRRLLENNELSVGITGHFSYRVNSDANFSFIQLIQGKSLSPLSTGSQGGMLDFDLGTTYDLPSTLLDLGEFKPSVGAAINNILGGYTNISLNLVSGQACAVAGKCEATPQPRTFSFGASLARESWWKVTNTVFALEFTDIGNNSSGSLFRLLHLGGETHYGRLAIRLGVNQGYWTAGLGLDLRFVTLDLVSYGEEMSLNVGGIEDRRYGLKLAFQVE